MSQPHDFQYSGQQIIPYLDQDGDGSRRWLQDRVLDTPLGLSERDDLENLRKIIQTAVESLGRVLDGSGVELLVFTNVSRLVDVVQRLGIREEVVPVVHLEAQQLGELSRQEPVLPLGAVGADGECLCEIRLRVALEAVEVTGQGGAESGRLGGDEAVVVVLEIVDSRVLGGCNVDAHGDGVDELFDSLDGWEGCHLATILALDLLAPGNNVLVVLDVRVALVLGLEHRLDKLADDAPEQVHVVGVRVVAVLFVLLLLNVEASLLEVVGDVLVHKVEVLVRVVDELEGPVLGPVSRRGVPHGAEAGDSGDDGGDEECAGGSVEGKGSEPVGAEDLVQEMALRDGSVGGDDDGLLDHVRVDEMSGDLVSRPVSSLGAGLGVSPRPVLLLVDLVVVGGQSLVEDGDGLVERAPVVDGDGERVKSSILVQLEDDNRRASVSLCLADGCVLVIEDGDHVDKVLLVLEARGLAEVGVVLNEKVLALRQDLLDTIKALLLSLGNVLLDLVLGSRLNGGRVDTAQVLLSKASIRVPVLVLTDVAALHDIGSWTLVIPVPLLAVGKSWTGVWRALSFDLLGDEEADGLGNVPHKLRLVVVKDLADALTPGLLLWVVRLVVLLIIRKVLEMRRIAIGTVGPLVDLLLGGEISLNGEDGLEASGVIVSRSTQVRLARLSMEGTGGRHTLPQ